MAPLPDNGAYDNPAPENSVTGDDERHPAGEPGTEERRKFDDLVARAAEARDRGEATVPIDPDVTGDERRAEIEAVAEAIHGVEAEHSWLVGEGRIGAWDFASDDLKDLRRNQATAALDRVRNTHGTTGHTVPLSEQREGFGGIA